MSKKVPVQKGSIDPNPITIRQQTREEQVAQALHEKAERRRCQTLDLVEPFSRTR